MANRRINGDIEGDVILVGGLVLGFFLVAKPLLDQFGEDPADKANITNQKTLAPSLNCFSYQFAPFVNNFNANQPTDTNGNPLTMQEYFQGVKAANDAGTPLIGPPPASLNIAGLGEALRSALSIWNLATDNSAVFAVFANFSGQTQVASLAAYLMFNYNQDLLTAITGSIFHMGLSSSDLSTLITQMNALPI